VSNRPRAVLVLADGTVFHGDSIGAEGITIGEVAFNTAMTGYQEILTDPSYCRQIVTLTYPHIGNTGVNDEDIESTTASRIIHAAGLVVRDLSLVTSSWRSRHTGFSQTAWCAGDCRGRYTQTYAYSENEGRTGRLYHDRSYR